MGSVGSTETAAGTLFRPTKLLSVKDTILVDMLNGAEHSKNISYCVTDPDLEDNPIIFSSDGFCTVLGYAKEDVEGRNCRFLQGAETDPGDIAKIREAVKEKKEACLCLVNYKADGSTFHNQFSLTPLFDADGNLVDDPAWVVDRINVLMLNLEAYFMGVQVQVKSGAKGQEPNNPAWVYTMGLHE